LNKSWVGCAIKEQENKEDLEDKPLKRPKRRGISYNLKELLKDAPDEEKKLG